MKIDKKIFQSFLEGILLKGDRQNKECLLSVSDKSIKCQLLSGDNTTAIRGELKGDFGLALGDVGIDNLVFLVDVLKTFKDDDIKVEKVSNKLVMTQKKQKASLILRDVQYIKNTLADEKLAILESKEKKSFVLPSETVKEISSFLSSYKSRTIQISGEKKEVSVYIESNENTFEKSYDLEETVGDFEITLGSPFIDVIGSVSQDLTVRTPNGKVFECSVSDENKTLEYFVAMVKDKQ